MIDLGLYIHIPYCLHKCGYCDFNSHPINSDETDFYLDALFREMEHYGKQWGAKSKISTIFLGGGTPTTLPVSALEKILETCHRHFSIKPDSEITLETNPAAIRGNELKKIRSAGYNRISIGAQSFHSRELQMLDRVHGVEEIHRTVERARLAGFDNLSLDLMFAIPGQSAADWEYSLSQAIAHNPDHISAYNLTIEPGTAFYKLQVAGRLKMPIDDFQLKLYKQTSKTLQTAGYRQYEISNYAKPGRECRHNLNYWENGDYLGLGAGASSYINGVRFKNICSPSRYITEIAKCGTAMEFEERMGQEKSMGETMMLGLRLLKGIDLKRFEKRFRVSLEEAYGPIVSSLQKQKLISMKNHRIALSKKGLYLADSVILNFIA